MIYLDHAATTPVDPRVFAKMMPCFSNIFGNPSSIHTPGQEALKAIDKARQQAANFLNCETQEIVFTSGATESDNLAIKGIIEAINIQKPHIITTKIEHPAILETCKYLENKGVEITYLPVDKEGIVNTKVVQANIKENTALISIMYANNEIGTIQPIQDIGVMLDKINKNRRNKIYFHTDAVQAAPYLNCDVKNLQVDLLSISGHKLYGPKGMGLLYIKKGTKIKPIQQGGHQEYHLRAGTLNTPGIVGLGETLELIKKEQSKSNQKIKYLRDYLIDQIKKRISDVQINGSIKKRLPNNANISFNKVEGESIMLNLDFAGIYVSTGSACASGSLSPSHVLMAINLTHSQAHGSVRFTLGKDTSKKDIDYTLNVLVKTINRLRKISPIK